MSASSAEDCETVAGLARSPILITTLLLCDLCCLAAIPLLGYWLIRIWKMQLMHHNSRLLVCFHIFWLLVHLMGRVTQHSTDLILYMTPFKSGCELMHTKTSCFFLRLPYNAAIFVLNCSAIFISIERLVASFYIRSYERGFRSLGYGLLTSQLLMGVFVLCIIYSPMQLNDTPMLYCQITSPSNYMWTIYPYGFLFAMQILSTIIFEVASKKNKDFSIAPYSIFNNLSKRYQVEENLWTIRTLKVYVYTNACFTAAYLVGFSFVTFTNASFTKPMYYSLIELTTNLYLYALVLPFVLWYNRKNVRLQIREAIRSNITVTSNRIFEDLRLQWDMSTPRQTPLQQVMSLTLKVDTSQV